jgi:cysteinyl-tRNA synthetase
MDIKLYNTLTNKKEVFQPIEPGQVKIYACGETVYDRSHLGHARSAINFDVMRNVFKTLGYAVTYVRNHTDIDDKMINRANERGITVAQLAEEMIGFHDIDMSSLGINPPDFAPRATEYVPQIIEMIQSIYDKGLAYEAGGDVFFRVREFEEYGKLSGKNIDDLQSGARVEVDDSKDDALDFVLWKGAKPGEPTWDSPWGPGRPGWHIECSAMGKDLLGTTFDIHTGGSDLIFPHHENEIAQSECANEQTFVNFWLHNGMIKIEGEKMSKSLGNFAIIADLVEKYHPELVRFFILSTQYRQSLDFSEAAVESRLEGLDRIYGALEKFESNKAAKPSAEADFDKKQLEEHHQRFLQAIADDLNTPQAIGVLFELTRVLNSIDNQDPVAELLYKEILDLGDILGILKISPSQWFKTQRIKKTGSGLTDTEIDQLIEDRRQAREDKNWQRADEIRDQLQAASIQLEDREGKTFWRRS